MIETKHHLDLSRSTLPALELRFAESGEVSGYASTFGGRPDSYGDVIAPGAFAATLAEHASNKTMPAMLWSHNPDEVIGRWLDLKEDGKGLLVRGQLNLGTQRGKEAHALLKAGDVDSMSIGFRARDYALGTKPSDPYRTLKKIDLVEISIVAMPANRNARVTGVKTIESKAELIDLLRGSGLPKAAAHKIAAGGWPALDNGEGELEALLKRIGAATSELKNRKG